jgi:hypothetical protein
VSENALIGNAGVFFVAGELSRRGWVVMPTVRNTEGVDILANKENTSVQLQVKTSSQYWVWMFRKKAETLKRKSLFYIFVTLNKYDSPEYFVIPSDVVADYITLTHKEFLKHGGSKNSPIKFPSRYGKDILKPEDFKDRWDLLDH